MAKKSNKNTNTTWLLVILALVAGLLVGLQLIKSVLDAKEQQIVNPKGEQKEFLVGNTKLRVEIRDSESERELGLSGRRGLGENEGMLFVFPEKDRQIFWMKDMLFSIDVLWIVDGQVVDIMTNVPNPTPEEPKVETMISAMPVNAVLEVPAGFVEKYQVKVGDRVGFIQ